jgi:hypothetical protein
MAEYIEREALIAYIEKRQDEYSDGELSFNDMCRGEYNGLELARERISNVPSADVVPVVRGRWEEADDGDGVVCSVCREDFCTIYLETERFNYCPNCGARMKEGRDG